MKKIALWITLAIAIVCAGAVHAQTPTAPPSDTAQLAKEVKDNTDATRDNTKAVKDNTSGVDDLKKAVKDNTTAIDDLKNAAGNNTPLLVHIRNAVDDAVRELRRLFVVIQDIARSLDSLQERFERCCHHLLDTLASVQETLAALNGTLADLPNKLTVKKSAVFIEMYQGSNQIDQPRCGSDHSCKAAATQFCKTIKYTSGRALRHMMGGPDATAPGQPQYLLGSVVCYDE